MAITIECPSCRARAQVPETAAGSNGKCRACGSVVVVPGGVSKQCFACGVDVARTKRWKDSGNNYCDGCWAARTTSDEPDLSSLSDLERNVSAAADELLSCPTCHGRFNYAQMDRSGECKQCARATSRRGRSSAARDSKTLFRVPEAKPAGNGLLRLGGFAVVAVLLFAVAFIIFQTTKSGPKPLRVEATKPQAEQSDAVRGPHEDEQRRTAEEASRLAKERERQVAEQQRLAPGEQTRRVQERLEHVKLVKADAPPESAGRAVAVVPTSIDAPTKRAADIALAATPDQQRARDALLKKVADSEKKQAGLRADLERLALQMKPIEEKAARELGLVRSSDRANRGNWVTGNLGVASSANAQVASAAREKAEQLGKQLEGFTRRQEALNKQAADAEQVVATAKEDLADLDVDIITSALPSTERLSFIRNDLPTTGESVRNAILRLHGVLVAKELDRLLAGCVLDVERLG